MTQEQFPILGAWIAVGVTLAMYSFLYGDNPFFKVGEHLYIGISAGYFVVLYYHDYLLKKFYDPLVEQGDYLVLIPAAVVVFVAKAETISASRIKSAIGESLPFMRES